MLKRRGAFALKSLNDPQAPLAFALVREPVTLAAPPDLSWFKRPSPPTRFPDITPKAVYMGMGKTVIQMPDETSFWDKLLGLLVSVITPFLAPILSVISDVIYSIIKAIKDVIGSMLSAIDMGGVLQTLTEITRTLQETAFKGLEWLSKSDVTRWIYKGVDMFSGGYLESVKKMTKMTGDISRADIHDKLTSLVKVPDAKLMVMAEIRASTLRTSAMLLDKMGLSNTALGRMIKNGVMITENAVFDGAEITDAFKTAGRQVIQSEIQTATGLDVAKQNFIESSLETIASGDVPDVDFSNVQAPTLNIVPQLSIEMPSLNLSASGLSLSNVSPGESLADPSKFSLDSPEAREALSDQGINNAYLELRAKLPNPEDALKLALALWNSRNKSKQEQEQAVKVIQNQMPEFKFDFSYLFAKPAKSTSWWPVALAAAAGLALVIGSEGD